jgi:hypothetical protein
MGGGIASAVCQFPMPTLSRFTPLIRRMPAERLGLRKVQSAATAANEPDNRMAQNKVDKRERRHRCVVGVGETVRQDVGNGGAKEMAGMGRRL